VVTNAGELLQTAVHHHSAASRKGLLERAFTFFFSGFVYNQIWEDPRVDLEALNLTRESRILTISSGGCNVLNYLVDGPHSITAVDLNPCHLYLTQLKIAALKGLPDFEEFFRFFGEANSSKNTDNYYRYVRQHLEGAARSFWEGGFSLTRPLTGPRINFFSSNFYDHARNGACLRFFHTFAKLIGCDPARILKATSRDEQEQLFEETVAPFFDNRVIRFIGKLPVTVFGFGIPPQQFQKMNDETAGDMVGMYRSRVKRLACDFPIEDNYFAWQAFSRRYDCTRWQAVPEYLKRENYAALKANAGRVTTKIDSLSAYLRTQPANSLDRFVFLDAQDWMKPADLFELWNEVARVGRNASRIIFRTASSVSPVEKALPEDLRARFTYEEDLSERLHSRDRAAIYGGFHVYALAK